MHRIDAANKIISSEQYAEPSWTLQTPVKHGYEIYPEQALGLGGRRTACIGISSPSHGEKKHLPGAKGVMLYDNNSQAAPLNCSNFCLKIGHRLRNAISNAFKSSFRLAGDSDGRPIGPPKHIVLPNSLRKNYYERQGLKVSEITLRRTCRNFRPKFEN